MTTAQKFVCITMLALPLFACSAKEEEPKGAIPEAQLQAMDKAKELENVLKQADKARMEEAEKPD